MESYINEIRRIQEIMGVPIKNLILEQKGGLLKDLLQGFVERAIGKFDQGVIRGLARTTREIFEERLSTIIKRLEDGLSISPSERKFLTGVIRSVAPDIPVRLFNDFIGPALDEIGKTLPVFGRENFLKALRNPKLSDDEVVKKIGKALKLGTEDSLIPDMTLDDLMALRKHFKPEGAAEEIITIPKKRPQPVVDVTPEPKPDDEPPVTPDEPTVTPDVEDELSPEYIRRRLENIPQLDDAYVLRISRLNRGFAKSLRRIRQYIVDKFTSINDLTNECIQLMANYRNLDAPDQEDALKRIENLIDKIASRETELINDVNRWINIELRPHDYTAANELQALPKFQRALALLSPKQLQEWINKFGTLSIRRGKMWTQFFKIISPFQWFGKRLGRQDEAWFIAVIKKWKDILWSSDEYKELRSYIATGQTKNWEALKDYAKRRGWLRAGLSVGKEWLWNYAATSFVLAELEFCRDALAAFLGETSLNRFKWIEENKNELSEWGINIDLNELLHTTDIPIAKDITKPFSGLINGLSDQIIRIIKEGNSLNFKLPGFILNTLAFYQNLKIDGLQRLRESVSRADQLIQQGEQRLQNTAQQTQQTVRQEIQNIDYAASENGFRTWALASGKDFRGFSDLTKRGYTTDGEIYYQEEPGKKGYVEYTPRINSVSSLLQSVNGLDGNKSRIVMNPDGSFTETLSLNPEAPHITREMVGDYVIDVKPDGKAYYISAKGTPIQPFELKNRPQNQQ